MTIRAAWNGAWQPTSGGILDRTGPSSSATGSRPSSASDSGGASCDWPPWASCAWVWWRDPTSWHSTARRRSSGSSDSAAPAVARRWSDLLEWHPSLPIFWPALDREARLKKVEWLIKAADVQVANGTAPADLPERLGQLKDQAPQLTPAIRKVEEAQEQSEHDERWKAVQGEALSLAAADDPATAAGGNRQILARVSRDAPSGRGALGWPGRSRTSWRPADPPRSGRFSTT